MQLSLGLCLTGVQCSGGPTCPPHCTHRHLRPLYGGFNPISHLSMDWEPHFVSAAKSITAHKGTRQKSGAFKGILFFG